MKLLQVFRTSFTEIFNFQNDDSKGRVINITSSLLTTVYNVFITGIFYTGFLSMYGMSITDAGILTFIPYIANLLSIFSPKILAHFPQRKKILIASKIAFYAIFILGANIMPQFVKDPDSRLKFFVAIVGFAYGLYALFSPGFTTWFYNFYPEDNNLRARFLIFSQIFSSIMSSVILLTSSLITDALSGSPYQDQLILAFRYFAFVLVLIDVFIQSKAIEYPYADAADIKLREIFTLPLQYKKFFRCMMMMFIWNYVANLNNGLWQYHLLNHMNFSYTMINGVAVLYTVILLIFSPVWQKVLRRYSWMKTFGIACLVFLPTEIIFFFLAPETTFLFVPTSIYQHIASVGLNIAWANILYMNLPAENSTAHITFNAIGSNIFAFLGLMTGTFISGITGDDTMLFLGMEVYSVQFTTIARAIMLFSMGVFLIWKWRIFTQDEAIADVEQQQIIRQKYRRQITERFPLYNRIRTRIEKAVFDLLVNHQQKRRKNPK